MSQLRIGEALGQGAVGRVVRIYRDGDPAPLAGKILHTSHRSDPAASARFRQEARIAAALDHANIVAVFGIESVGDQDVLLMEYVAGPTLAQHLARSGPLGQDTIVSIARGLAAGLAHAHGRGVIHRDLKPANVLLAEADRSEDPNGPVPKIADFGMARGSSTGGDPAVATDSGGAADLRRAGLTVLGTPDYMAPECLDPLAVDARADLYALGCIMFEMATGRPPFVGATPHAVLRAHRDDDIPAIPDTLTPALRGLVHALLAKSPGQRPQAASAVVDALDRIAGGETAMLARVGPSSVRCAVCDRPLVAGVGACMSCGQALLRHEPGDCSVIVLGPGDPGDKIDSELRGRLCAWLESQPDLGLVASKALARRIPRLPFTLARGLGRAHADVIVTALGELGLVAEATAHHPLRIAAMRRKAVALSGRVGLVALTSSAGLLGSGPGLAFGLFATAVLLVATTVVSTGRVTRRRPQDAALPVALRDALGRTVAALGAVVSERHRDALRAVVERATELARDPALAGDSGTGDELARAVDAATAAAGTLERLDRALVGPRLGGESDATRDVLHTRDLWAARLAAVLAELDGIRDRLARARAGTHARAAGDELAALRAHVEALEEVQT